MINLISMLLPLVISSSLEDPLGLIVLSSASRGGFSFGNMEFLNENT